MSSHFKKMNVQKNYLTLTNERRVRLIHNSTTEKELKILSQQENSHMLKGKTSIGELRRFLWLCAVEGEKEEGRELGLNEIEFARLINLFAPEEISKFVSKIAFPAN
jgi:hypothetical protein